MQDSSSSPPPPTVPPEDIKDTVKEEIGNGMEEIHPKAVKREAENGVDAENGEPPVKIKKESKYNHWNCGSSSQFHLNPIHDAGLNWWVKALSESPTDIRLQRVYARKFVSDFWC